MIPKSPRNCCATRNSSDQSFITAAGISISRPTTPKQNASTMAGPYPTAFAKDRALYGRRFVEDFLYDFPLPRPLTQRIAVMYNSCRSITCALAKIGSAARPTAVAPMPSTKLTMRFE